MKRRWLVLGAVAAISYGEAFAIWSMGLIAHRWPAWFAANFDRLVSGAAAEVYFWEAAFSGALLGLWVKHFLRRRAASKAAPIVAQSGGAR